PLESTTPPLPRPSCVTEARGRPRGRWAAEVRWGCVSGVGPPRAGRSAQRCDPGERVAQRTQPPRTPAAHHPRAANRLFFEVADTTELGEEQHPEDGDRDRSKSTHEDGRHGAEERGDQARLERAQLARGAGEPRG